jgi:hypothetical protein
MNALMSFFLHIPFPEDMDDDTWMEKWRQIEWLSEKGLLGSKIGESAIKKLR